MAETNERGDGGAWAWVLFRAAAAADVQVQRDAVLAAAAQATTERATPEERLVQASRDLGLVPTALSLSPAEAARMAGPRCPLAVHTSQGWILLEDHRRTSARARRSDEAAAWVSIPELRAGLDADVATFWALDAARPFESNERHDHHGPSPAARLWEVLRAERGDLAVLAVYAAFVGVLSLTIPVATQALVNTVAFGTLLQPILVLSGVLLVALGFWAVVNALEIYVVELLQRRLFVRVVADIVHRLPRVAHTASRGLPELVNRFFDVLTVQKSLSTLLLDGLSLLLTTVIGMTLLAVYHPLFLGFDVALFAAMLFGLFALGRGAQTTSIDESKAKYEIAAWLEEIARHPLAFKSDGGPELAATRADGLAHRYLAARGRHFRVVLRQIASFYGLYALASAALFAVGGWMVLERQLTLGQLVAAELIVSTILGGFSKLGKQLEAFYDLLAAMDKLGHLADLPLERSGGESPAPRPGPAAVTVHDVAFDWPDGAKQLAGVGLDIVPGARVALSGAGGAGKSTLLKILFGALEPSSGYVRLDGIDLRDLRLDAIRRDVALVSGIELIDGSVFDNVAFGRPWVTQADARAALGRVGLHDVIPRLPHGMRTRLAEDGAPLSRGDAARLMLARALVCRPRVLLVDALFDTLTVDELPRACDAVFPAERDFTVVLVAHRPEVLRRCDRVVQLSPEPPIPSPEAA